MSKYEYIRCPALVITSEGTYTNRFYDDNILTKLTSKKHTYFENSLSNSDILIKIICNFATPLLDLDYFELYTSEFNIIKINNVYKITEYL